MRLARLVVNERDALRADLRRYFGVRLDDFFAGVESLADVCAFAWECQYIEGSALRRALLGDDSDWTTTNQLLALVADHSAIANWFQTKDGQKGKNRPKQIPRPGVRDEEETTYGKGTSMSMDEARKWLGWK